MIHRLLPDHLSHLPAPSADAIAHSERLAAHIRGHIASAGGWISFAAFMDLALHAPGLGYYSAGMHKFGSDGDFVTAPELGALFATALARQAAQLLQNGSLSEIIEYGAGSGRLARDLLRALAAGGLREGDAEGGVSRAKFSALHEALQRRVVQLLLSGLQIETTSERVQGVVVFVRDKDVKVHPDAAAAKSQKVVLDNKDCRFSPHVAFVQLLRQASVLLMLPSSHCSTPV